MFLQHLPVLDQVSQTAADFAADNDGILLAPTSDGPKGSLMNVSANNRTAESVLNSAMAVGILRGYSAVLAAAPKPVVAVLGGDLTTNVSYLRQLEAQQQAAVTATWGVSSS